jgi:hypothetical protein
MRDMVRAELEQAHQQGPLGRLLDNTWVLIGLLGLLIVGGVLWFRGSPGGPEDGAMSERRQKEAAVRAKAKVPLTVWLNASPGTEADPLVARAIRQLDDGETAAARDTLTAIGLLTVGTDGTLGRLHAEVLPKSLRALEPILPADADADRSALRRSALRRAEQHAEKKELARAAEIWKSIVLLYQDDPHAATDVALARRRLAELESPSPLP